MNETPEQTGQHQALKFEHTGRAGKIASIAVVVGLLNIVTLSFLPLLGKDPSAQVSLGANLPFGRSPGMTSACKR